MWESVALLAGLVVGGLVGWLWARRAAQSLQIKAASAQTTIAELRDQLGQRDTSIEELRVRLENEQQERARKETSLTESARQVEEQKCLVKEMGVALKESFEALSAKALQANAEQFLQNAKKTLDVVVAEARGDLGKREEAIKGLVQPMKDTLTRYEGQVKSLEESRQKAYFSLEEQVKGLAVTHQQLQQETGKLVTALRDPKVRGRWGEVHLRRTAELAGMVEHCDFDQQVHIAAEDGVVRPDMIVRLPTGRTVAVDAKSVLDAYMDAVAATDEPSRREHLKRHASQVRTRVAALSSKSYWDKLEGTPEFVVLFLPGESFFSAALEMDPTLIEDAFSKRVLLASPTTLIALLHIVARGWQQVRVAENAEEITRLGKELFERIRTFIGHFAKLGSQMSTTVNTYNDAIGSWEHSVSPSVRRFKELGAGAGDDLPDISAIDRVPRQLSLPGSDAA